MHNFIPVSNDILLHVTHQISLVKVLSVSHSLSKFVWDMLSIMLFQESFDEFVKIKASQSVDIYVTDCIVCFRREGELIKLMNHPFVCIV